MLFSAKIHLLYLAQCVRRFLRKEIQFFPIFKKTLSIFFFQLMFSTTFSKTLKRRQKTQGLVLIRAVLLNLVGIDSIFTSWLFDTRTASNNSLTFFFAIQYPIRRLCNFQIYRYVTFLLHIFRKRIGSSNKIESVEKSKSQNLNLKKKPLTESCINCTKNCTKKAIFLSYIKTHWSRLN